MRYYSVDARRGRVFSLAPCPIRGNAGFDGSIPMWDTVSPVDQLNLVGNTPIHEAPTHPSALLALRQPKGTPYADRQKLGRTAPFVPTRTAFVGLDGRKPLENGVGATAGYGIMAEYGSAA